MSRIMWNVLPNLFALLAVTLVAFAYQSGLLAPIDAIVAACAVLTVITGYELALREGMRFSQAFYSLFGEPWSFAGYLPGYVTYVISMVMGIVVILQALLLG